MCLGCGLYRTDPLPAAEELREYYRKLYRLEYKGVERPKSHHVLRAARAARDRLRWLRPHLPPGGGGWLEVGAGSGEFAYLMGREGFAVTALEPNAGYAGYLRDTLGLRVREGFLEDLEAAGEGWAGISCFHVLEHHPDPVEALVRMRRLLAPGGVLAVEVPNAAFTAVHPDHRFHEAHLVHFRLESLARAARRAGFGVKECRTSADGGVLWGVFAAEGWREAAESPAEEVGRYLDEEKRRSAVRYYGSPRVWGRTLERVARLGWERVRTLRFPGSQAYLAAMKLR